MNPSPLRSFPTMVWSVVGSKPFILERFEDDWLLFNPLSRTTHLVNGLVVEILELLRTKPVTLEILLNYLDLAEEEKETYERIGSIVSELDGLGLIQPSDP